MNYFASLKIPAFRDYFYAVTFGALSFWVIRFVIGWLTWEITHSAAWVGIVGSAMLAPAFVLSPVFGVLADRINPLRAMQLTTIADGLLCVLLAVLVNSSLFSLSSMLVIALAFGI